MTRSAVGFYWTLPVPWAGFTDIPDSIDEAATASATIRFQRDLIRRYAREERLHLIKEQVFLEIKPDRGSEQILEPLTKVEAFCKANEAVLLYVDFAELSGWRRHQYLNQWMSRTTVDVIPIPASWMEIEGFDPWQHFAEWRARQHQWIEGKETREARALRRASELRDEGVSHSAIAERLNSEGLPSLTGKRWSGANITKLLQLGRLDK